MEVLNMKKNEKQAMRSVCSTRMKKQIFIKHYRTGAERKKFGMIAVDYTLTLFHLPFLNKK